ncbi:MAG: prepilin peptidase [Pacificimonas sp.]
MSWISALFGTLAGLMIGSFIGVIGERWPRGEQAVRGRSRCDSCGRTLRVTEMVPLVSYMMQRGRCRRCRAAIPWRLPLVEMLAGTIGGLVFGLAQEPMDFVWAVFGWILLALALLDMRALWLPDRLTYPLIAAGLLVGALKGEALLALTGAAIGWASLFLTAVLYERLRGRRGLGGGDPKLFAGIGAWLGPGALPLVLLIAALSGLVAALGLKLAGHDVGQATKLPFGTLLALGVAGEIAFALVYAPPAFSIPLF